MALEVSAAAAIVYHLNGIRRHSEQVSIYLSNTVHSWILVAMCMYRYIDIYAWPWRVPRPPRSLTWSRWDSTRQGAGIHMCIQYRVFIVKDLNMCKYIDRYIHTYIHTYIDRYIYMHGPRQVSIHLFSTVYSSIWVSMCLYGFIDISISMYGPGGFRGRSDRLPGRDGIRRDQEQVCIFLSNHLYPNHL